MSIEKVRRYEATTNGRMKSYPDGRYIEYADVAGLVAVLRDIADTTTSGPHKERLARNELARWQS